MKMTELEKMVIGCTYLAAIVVAACNTPTILTPKTGVGTSYPCGVNGTLCTTQHMCCGPNETCGGEPASVGCPKGMCCFIGEGSFEMRPSPRAQTPPR
jgi:hypothetical protein